MALLRIQIFLITLKWHFYCISNDFSSVWCLSQAQQKTWLLQRLAVSQITADNNDTMLWCRTWQNVTLCGRILSSSAPLIPDFSSSALASSLLLPFIRASVWARKLDSNSWTQHDDN